MSLETQNMPLSIRDNLVEDVIRITKLVEQYRDDQASHENAEQVHDHFNDIHVHLCELMSAMIASPLSGRIFLAPPEAYVDAETKEASLDTQFMQKI